MAKAPRNGIYEDPHSDLLGRIENRRRKRLFLPALVTEAARDRRLATPERDLAYEKVKAWWDQARKGRLDGKETSLDDAFLRQVFGEALGYRGITESTESYERERQFTVPGVGPCDGALGRFPPPVPENVRVVMELKDSGTHLDRDRSGGRTAVQQLWDYLNAMPESCPWGIVSNFTTIRLYHRRRGSQAYEQFTMREIVDDRSVFDRFYAIFESRGLVRPFLAGPPRADLLLDRTRQQQREVGDELYELYSENRLQLIQHLHRQKGLDLDAAIRIAQKLIDRVLFVAFCEDRGLINPDTIAKVCKHTQYFSRDRNPVWHNFLGLFDAMDKGSDLLGVRNGYNGGLFREDPEYSIATLDLDDIPWTQFFRTLAGYDYRDTVDVDVLGHLFEKSVTELERLRGSGFFASGQDVRAPLMPKSPQRKLFGIYYTPPEFTTAIVEYTVGELVDERFAVLRAKHGLSEEDVLAGANPEACRAYWRDCLEALKTLKVCDPACGSGAFLIRAYDALFDRYALAVTELDHLGEADCQELMDSVPDTILNNNLYGVDLQPEAVEIAQLSLWLRTASREKTLAELSDNVVCGNSLTHDPDVDPLALNWPERFPDVFAGDSPGFDCVIGNPPWERLKLQEREFFALSAPEIASAVNAAERRRRIAALEAEQPELHAKYEKARQKASQMLDYARASGRYPLTGKGDINTYVLFAELATQVVAPAGRIGLLVPSGIATDKTTAKFFGALMAEGRVKRLYDFENREHVFPDVDGRFKFCIFNAGGAEVAFDRTDFLFFAHRIEEIEDPKRHVGLSEADLARMNPNTKTCPVFRHRRDAEITKGIYGRVPVLMDRTRKEGGNPWGVRFFTMFHQTNDASLFVEPAELDTRRFRREGNRYVRGKKTYLPLYEAKMVQAYDHRAASIRIERGNWVRQGQTIAPTLVERQNPEHVALPRWYVDEQAVRGALSDGDRPALLAYKDVTSPTNQRTMIAAFIPYAAVANSAPLMLMDGMPWSRRCCLLANLNSFVYDFVGRQKVGGVHLNFFIVEQLPVLPPDRYDERCPWDRRRSLEKWIAPRVLKLSCTANDMAPLGEACGMDPPVHKWKPNERSRILAELDAAYLLLYGIDRDDAIYILSTFQAARAKDAPGMFDPDADRMLSPAGRRVIDAYDKLAARVESS